MNSSGGIMYMNSDRGSMYMNSPDQNNYWEIEIITNQPTYLSLGMLGFVGFFYILNLV